MALELPDYDDPSHPHYQEFLPIIDTDGTILRLENRVITHRELLLHPVVRGIILTPEDKVIMQRKRLKTLPIDVLDTTTSGHIGGSLNDMSYHVGANVSELVLSTLQRESEEETGITIAPDEIIELGRTGLYSDLPEKTEIAYVMLSRTRKRVEDLTRDEGIVFEAIDVEEILGADKTGRIAWDIIGTPWAHIWEKVKNHISR